MYAGTWTRSVAPTIEPVTVAEVKDQLRIDGSADDLLVEALARTAREYLERVSWRAWNTQTWVLRLPAFPSEPIKLPRPPLLTVASVAYLDTSGDAQTVTAAEYQVDIYATPGTVRPAYGYSWPSTRSDTDNAVTITYTCGYGAAGADVPLPYRQALLLLIGHWYENREGTVAGEKMSTPPFAVDALLDADRVSS